MKSRTVSELVDDLGAVRAEMAELESRDKALREELIRRQVTEASGRLYRMAIVAATRSTLDAKGIRREMGDTWCEAHTRQTITTSVRVTLRSDAVKQALAA